MSVGGGSGKVNNMVVGILILTVLSNGMQLMQLGVYPQYVAKGLVLIIAIAIDTYQKESIVKKAKKVTLTDAEKKEAEAA